MDISVAVGRYGPYIAYNKRFYKLPKDTDIKNVTPEQAIDIIREIDKKNAVKSFTEDKKLKILKGKTGHYIAFDGKNYKIPKKLIDNELSYEDCMKIVEAANNKTKKQ